ncbi:MAG: BON domain-containing protein [Pirellulales bacterium]|nr:BON domain-containing protein [Pirellulales bacterium]
MNAPDMPVTDRELAERIVAFLFSRHVPGLRTLQVQVHNGVVTLSGKVLTFYEKQLCNQCFRRVAGVRQLINQVDVTTDEQPPSSPTEFVSVFIR